MDKVIELQKPMIHITDSGGNFLNLAAADKMPLKSPCVLRLKVGEGPLSTAVKKRVVIGMDMENILRTKPAPYQQAWVPAYLSIPIVFKFCARVMLLHTKTLPADEEDTC